MASPAVETKSCECACEKAPGCDSSCVCTVPCAFNSESKTFNWVCDCKSFKCKFQIRCNNKDQPCSASDTELFTLKCHCEKLECNLQIRKCSGCEIIRVECGGPTEGGCCKSKPESGSQCCKGDHNH